MKLVRAHYGVLPPPRRRFGLCGTLCLGLAAALLMITAPALTGGASIGAAENAARKLEHIKSNALSPHPDQRPTVLSEDEINSYVASGRAKLPKGVRSLRMGGAPGVIQARAQIDFDAVTAGKRNSNPLLSFFTGVHEVEATAHASGHEGRGQVRIESFSIDGISIPPLALELFAQYYLKSKYPGVGVDSSFPLPQRIDTATIGEHSLTLMQK